MSCWIKQNYGDSKKINGCQGVERRKRGMSKSSTEYHTLYDGIMVNIPVLIHLSELMECTTPRVIPSVKDGL